MISIIVAVAENGVIGSGNQMPWHISEDLRHFKAITTGHPVVMGRKTFESLGRPLPNRTNVVITRNPDYAAEGAVIAGSLEEALAMFPAGEEIFVIGGGEIYRQAMDCADRLYITMIGVPFDGDTCFPSIDTGNWRETWREEHPRGEKFPHPFQFVNYEKIRNNLSL